MLMLAFSNVLGIMDSGRTVETDFSASNCPVSTPELNDQKKVGLKRTPFSNKVHSHFKSPLQVGANAKVNRAEEVAELERRREELDLDIAQLEEEGYRVDELEHHIDKLHEYNDIKDIGQSLLGRIAALRGTTTRDLYTHFGLDLDD